MNEHAALADFLTDKEIDLRDEVAIRIYVEMNKNPETMYAEDAEDAFVAASAFIKARREWVR